MKCPNCNREMRDKTYSYYSFGNLGNWDMDYPDEYYEKHWCPTCCIEYINGEWNIPDSIIATDKQLKAGMIIEHNTGIKMPPPIKKLMCEYIGENMELSKRRYEEHKKEQEQLFEEWC